VPSAIQAMSKPVTLEMPARIPGLFLDCSSIVPRLFLDCCSIVARLLLDCCSIVARLLLDFSRGLIKGRRIFQLLFRAWNAEQDPVDSPSL
jgi:hypothetical protein